MNTRDKGNKGEDAAAKYLEHRGCRIITRNYYIRGGEVDLIFNEGDETVFCEVKLRTQHRFGMPSEAVDLRKQKHICKAALDYAYKNNKVDEKYRFDIIEIYNGKINHIKNAFEFIEP
ncbi:MAG: YraN family protein [Christensenellales bacterium]|jgi:putative endonuclease